MTLFNEGDYFEAHEVLEDLWVIEVEPLKTYYKGLIQVAVAICHWERGNASGARKLYHSGMRYLEPYPDHYEGLSLDALRLKMRNLFTPLLESTGTKLPLLDRDLIPVLEFRHEKKST